LSENKFKGVNGYIEGQTIKIHKRYGKTFEEPGTTVSIKLKWQKTNISKKQRDSLDSSDIRIKKWWKTLRNLSGLPCNSSNYPPLLLNDTYITKDIEKANAFNDYCCQQSS
jgi:hypothetical protein